VSNGLNGERLTKNERREQARENARQLREEHKKRDRRNRLFLQGGIILGVVAVAAIVVLLIVTSVRPAGPGPRNMASGGIQFTTGFEVTSTPALAEGAELVPNAPSEDPDVLNIQVWVDYLCPYCNVFEQTNQEYINSLVDSGAATLEVFPVAILDRLSLSTKYSTRAANAAACVADSSPESFMAFHASLFANQPGESTAGLDDSELVQLAKDAGATSQAVADCITSKRFQPFVTAATSAAVNNSALVNPTNGGFGTPTILVNGQRYDGGLSDADAFKAFLVQVAGAAFVEEETSTPTPTPTATP